MSEIGNRFLRVQCKQTNHILSDTASISVFLFKMQLLKQQLLQYSVNKINESAFPYINKQE